jgi:hypothetical protein
MLVMSRALAGGGGRVRRGMMVRIRLVVGGWIV